MSKIPDIEEDINKQIILTYVDSEYSGYLGMVIKVHDDRYMLKGMQIDNIFHNSAVTAWASTGHSILSAITKFRTNTNGNFTIFYVLKNWEEMLCVLNVILE